MSISSTTRKAGPYTGNGVTTALPFSFKVFTAADVRVVRTDLLGVESDLTLTTHYTVALNADQDSNPGGTVNLVTAAATGYLTTLTSAVADLQPVVLTNAGGFYPTVINTALDRLTIMVQQVAEKVGRALTVDISSSLNPSTVIAAIFTAETNAAASASAASSSAASAAASAASIPSMTGGADTVLVINPTNNGWLYKTATQMRTFLGLGSAALSNTGDFQAADADIPTVPASQAEMEAGTETALRSMSPLRVRQAIVAAFPTSMVRLNTANGYGSTNTKIRRFTTTVTNQGSDITYADSATLGASFTVNTKGVYAVSYVYQPAAGNNQGGVSLNTTSPTVAVSSIPPAEALTSSQAYAAGAATAISWTGYLPAGSVVRVHDDGAAAYNSATYQFTICRVA